MKKIFLFLIISIFLLSFVAANVYTENVTDATNGNADATGETGIKIYINDTGKLQLREVKIVNHFSSDNPDTVFIRNSSSDQIANATISTLVANFTSQNIILQPNTNYTITVDCISCPNYYKTRTNAISFPEKYGVSWTVDGSFSNATNANIWAIDYYVLSNDPSTTTILNSPANNSGINKTNAIFNATLSPLTGQLVNATIFVWNSTNGLVNQTTKTITGTVANSTLFNISNIGYGNYKWNVLGCSLGGTTHSCTYAPSNFTFNTLYIENANAFNTTAYELTIETVSLNITALSGTSIDTANLIYNGTTFAGTKTNVSSNYIISKAITHSAGDTGSKSFYWWINFSSGNQINTTINTQSVNQSIFGLCNSSLNVPYLNFTFQDETTLTNINASIISSSFEYWLISPSLNKTLIFSNTTANYAYAFCFSPPYKTLNVNSYIQYSSGTYPQRSYDPPSISYTNLSTNKILYLLSSSDGLYVTFQVINAAEQPLQGVAANATRVINGENTLVGAGTTGADGGITFWVNPDYSHTFTFALAPYPEYTLSLTPTQSSYTITLGSATSANVSDYSKGITYSIKPTVTYLSNGTTYNFNFTLSSSYWTLDSYGFNITNEDGTLLGAASATDQNGGVVSLDLNTVSNETFLMTYYWVVNGTVSSASRSWLILDTAGNIFSIARLVSDFNSYVTLGFFGITEFGVGIFCFLIILVITGTLRMKSSISDEATLIGIMFALVAFFDVSLGLLPNPVGAVDNFPTIFMGIIFTGFLFKEAFQ